MNAPAKGNRMTDKNQQAPQPAKGYEVFADPSYYDLWAAREIGVRDFYQTAHFETREAACAWTHDPSLPLDTRYN